MKFEECLTKMVAPSQRREGIMLGGIVQVMVTRACDKACCSCTQGSNLAGNPHHMSLEHFEQACLSLKDYFGVVGVFGGNPCLHPQFPELCGILRDTIPYERRGIWTNNLLTMGGYVRETFNPARSNLNVHKDQKAYNEFWDVWPECRSYLKGLHEDSRHVPPFVAMRDVLTDEEQLWELTSRCDVNQRWSALIGTFRGKLRAWFCELAGAQSMLHQGESDYPDTGIDVFPGWWNLGIGCFSHQVKKHCPDCGIPLRSHGQLAVTDDKEQVSETHQVIVRPKRKGRQVELVTDLEQLGVEKLRPAVHYLEGERT